MWCINATAEVVCDFSRSHSVAGGNTAPTAVIKQMFYPKYSTPENYECRRKKKRTGGEEQEEGGYGGLFSLTFTSRAAWEGFFDVLQCFKGMEDKEDLLARFQAALRAAEIRVMVQICC